MKFSKQKLLTLKKKKQKIVYNNYKQLKRTICSKKIKGTYNRPRFSVYRSNKYLYVQIIDDLKGQTLISCTTQQREIKEFTKNNCTIVTGKMLGKKAAELSLKKNIKKVIFDRGSYLYHGKIKAIAEGARSAGLKF